MAIGGLLLDLEGVLYEEGKAIPGAVETVRLLGQRGFALRFLTNTTTRPRSQIVERMKAMGFDVRPDQVFTPALAARQILGQEKIRRVHVAAAPEFVEDLGVFYFVDEKPETVIMGDLYTDFTWERLNELFSMLMDGARLVALHRNRYCRRDAKLALDLGPFVAALEYAADIESLVVGKPSRSFFSSAVGDMGLDLDSVIMVGDDIEADIGGALAAGLRAIQVETGKYSPRDDDQPSVRPSARMSSIADLPEWLALHS